MQGLDGEATEPMIKELEEDREESQDPEVEFAIAGAVREYGGLEILLDLIQVRLCLLKNWFYVWRENLSIFTLLHPFFLNYYEYDFELHKSF